jgi:hypothetical protein
MAIGIVAKYGEVVHVAAFEAQSLGALTEYVRALASRATATRPKPLLVVIDEVDRLTGSSDAAVFSHLTTLADDERL